MAGRRALKLLHDLAAASLMRLEVWWRLGRGELSLPFEFLLHHGLSSNPLSTLAGWLGSGGVALLAAFVPLLAFVAMRAVLRRDPWAEAATLVVGTALFTFALIPRGVADWLCALVLVVFALRVGIIAVVTGPLTRIVLVATPYTLDTDRFYFDNTPLAIVVVGGAALLAWRVARGRPAEPGGGAAARAA